MRLLETLAGVQGTDRAELLSLLQDQRYQLGWGTTLIVITGKASEELIHELYQARRGGQNAILIQTGSDAADEADRQRARTFGIPVFSVTDERDLQTWMQRTKHA